MEEEILLLQQKSEKFGSTYRKRELELEEPKAGRISRRALLLCLHTDSAENLNTCFEGPACPFHLGGWAVRGYVENSPRLFNVLQL